jgi:hypothetical protein
VAGAGRKEFAVIGSIVIDIIVIIIIIIIKFGDLVFE